MESMLNDMVLQELQPLIDAAMASVGITIAIVIIILGVMWALMGYKWLCIGRKAGLDKDWMPFVPFAKTIYRLDILQESWWKMFFFEGWWLYAILLYRIIVAISSGKWITFGVIVVSLYLLSCLGYNVYWRFKFYTALGMKPYLGLGVIIPFEIGRRCSMDYHIAFTDNFAFGGSRAKTSSPRSNASAPQRAPKQSSAGSISGLSGMYAGQEIPLAANEELLIGRDNTMCNLIIDQRAEKLSRKHCSITYDGMRGVYMVTDFSSNGTYIDGGNRLVANMATQMQSGTVIALGNKENRFRLN
ncbi:MAG: FHA domain-containing protein [Eubacteriales bacterium]